MYLDPCTPETSRFRFLAFGLSSLGELRDFFLSFDCLFLLSRDLDRLEPLDKEDDEEEDRDDELELERERDDDEEEDLESESESESDE